MKKVLDLDAVGPRPMKRRLDRRKAVRAIIRDWGDDNARQATDAVEHMVTVRKEMQDE